MIEIVNYRAAWNAEFHTVAAALGEGLGDAALRIDHIGSTAVPNLCAKDVLDIQITVARLDEGIAACIAKLGFTPRPQIRRDHVPPGCNESEAEWQKLFFVEPTGARRMNIHVRAAGRLNQRYALLFRDYLVAQPHVASAYGELKRRLAASLVNSHDYAEVKDPAVDLIYFAAEQWARHEQWQPQPGSESQYRR